MTAAENRPPEPLDITEIELQRASDRAEAGDLWLALQQALASARDIADSRGCGEIGQKEIATYFREFGIKFCREEDLTPLEDIFDVSEMIQEIARKCEEHEHLRGRPFRVWWWVTPSVSKGRVKLGQAGAISGKDRALWPVSPAPWFRMGLSLPFWLLATPMERLRLVHHEAMHCDIEVNDDGIAKPITRPHDVEEFTSTIGRFGPGDPVAHALIANAVRHPKWEAAKGFYERDQGDLFPEWGK